MATTRAAAASQNDERMRAAVPPILRPVQLSLVTDSVSSIADAAVAMRHCVHLCSVMAHQQRLLKNTCVLRTAPGWMDGGHDAVRV